MPNYSFICDCGETQEVNRPMSEATEPVFCVICKQAMCRHYQADFGKQGRCDTYPFASYAAGVSLSEVPAMREIDRKAGVLTDYTTGPDGGDPIFRSPSHRKKYCRVHGLYDRDASYGDPEPVNR